MKKIAFIFALVALASCANKETKTAAMQDSASVDDYQAFLEPLREMDLDNKSVQSSLQNKLLTLFEKENPKSSLSSYEKMDSMVAMLMTYNENNSDLMTTAGMIDYSEVDGALQEIRLSVLNQLVVNRNPDMNAEIQSWSAFYNVMLKYCAKMGHLQYFGGSMAPLMSSGAVDGLLMNRVNDLKSLSGTGNLNSATTQFKEQIRKNDNYFAPESDSEKDYINLYKEFIALDAELTSTFSKWVEVRNTTNPAGITQYISTLINSITPDEL